MMQAIPKKTIKFVRTAETTNPNITKINVMYESFLFNIFSSVHSEYSATDPVTIPSAKNPPPNLAVSDDVIPHSGNFLVKKKNS